MAFTRAMHWEQVYASPWHNPGLAFVSGIATLVAYARGRDFLGRFAAVSTVAIMLDAYLDAALSPIPSGSTLATVVAVVFVILGDLRWYLLLERYTRTSLAPRFATLGWVAARTIAWALLVPVANTLQQHVVPEAFRGDRWQWLTYEAMFVAVALAWRFVILPRRTSVLAGTHPETVRWLDQLATFEIVQYALWALADVFVLRGFDWGFALRIVPNVMYYAAFVPFAVGSAPREVRA